MGAIIRVENVFKAHRLLGGARIDAVRGASLVIAEGEMAAIVGPAGCGKSTMARLIAGLIRPESGYVRVGSQRVDMLRGHRHHSFRTRYVGFVRPGMHLNPTVSVAQTVAAIAESAGLSPKEAAVRADEVLELVGLQDCAARMMSRLSADERRRTAIARALVNKPQVVVADEPTEGLDLAASEEIFRMMRRVNLQTGITLLITTRNEKLAPICDRSIRMCDGAVIDNGFRPVDDRVGWTIEALG